MDLQRYPVEIEVAAPLAIFTRPDSGGTPTSYPVPTWSAAKGIFESIAFFADGAAWICPTSVQVCRRVGEEGGQVSFQRYTTNYGGPLRKKSLFNKGTSIGGSSMQVFATVLSDVCYRLHGIVVGPRRSGTDNPRHHLQDLFVRRLKRGQCHCSIFLGWREFVCSYWGPFREGITEIDTALSLEIPSMLLSVWDNPSNGCYSPVFHQDVQIRAGEIVYDVPAEWTGKEEREVDSYA